MTTLERLRSALNALSLTAIDARLEPLLETASKQESSYADFLLEVISAEADARRQRYLKTRLQLAHLPYVKTFDQFDFGFQPSIDERQILVHSGAEEAIFIFLHALLQTGDHVIVHQPSYQSLSEIAN